MSNKLEQEKERLLIETESLEHEKFTLVEKITMLEKTLSQKHKKLMEINDKLYD